MSAPATGERDGATETPHAGRLRSWGTRVGMVLALLALLAFFLGYVLEPVPCPRCHTGGGRNVTERMWADCEACGGSGWLSHWERHRLASEPRPARGRSRPIVRRVD